MTYSRKGPDSCKRSVLKDTRPVVEQDAHFFVIRWMRICVGLTFMVSVQRAISALSSSFVNTVSPFYRLLCQPAIPLKDLHLPYISYLHPHPSLFHQGRGKSLSYLRSNLNSLSTIPTIASLPTTGSSTL